MSNTTGNIFRVTTFGESHGPAVGCVIDGCPAGVPFDADDIREYFREDGMFLPLRTARREEAGFEILSGVYMGATLGTPVAIISRNTGARPQDYEKISAIARPSHAELTYNEKYGFIDPRGGGRASGRECAARHMAAALADVVITLAGIELEARMVELAGIGTRTEEGLVEAMRAALEAAAVGDSTGGVFEIVIRDAPAGLGGPVFSKLDQIFCSAVMSVGGVTGVEIGSGFALAAMRGSDANDPIYYDRAGIARTRTNNGGGIQGGISNGMDVIIRASVKPTPSIGIEQETVDLVAKKNATVKLSGRFDSNFAPRAMTAALSTVRLALVDQLIASGSIHPDRLAESPLIKARLGGRRK